jgi:hypothetical protein
MVRKYELCWITSCYERYELYWITSLYDPTEGFCKHDNGTFRSITIYKTFLEVSLLSRSEQSLDNDVCRDFAFSIAAVHVVHTWGVSSCLVYIHVPYICYHHIRTSIFPQQLLFSWRVFIKLGMNLVPLEVTLYRINKSTMTALQTYFRVLSSVSRSMAMNRFPILGFPPIVQ